MASLLPNTLPLAMLMELTHRCPLRCAYCSNPLALRKTLKNFFCRKIKCTDE